MTLQVVEPGQIWSIQQPVRIGPFSVRTRCTVVRLADGGLWIHSPVAPTSELQAALRTLGDVRYAVAPNASHHLFLGTFLAAFPAAIGCIAPGIADKRPDLAHLPVLGTAQAPSWEPTLHAVAVAGIPALHETVWFHTASRTLILTDLLFSFAGDSGFLTRQAARLLGVHRHLGMSRTMKLLVKDRAALSATAAALLALDARRVIVAHDQIVDQHAQAALENAFAWLNR